jgi:hypothetical protein
VVFDAGIDVVGLRSSKVASKRGRRVVMELWREERKMRVEILLDHVVAEFQWTSTISVDSTRQPELIDDDEPRSRRPRR